LSYATAPTLIQIIAPNSSSCWQRKRSPGGYHVLDAAALLLLLLLLCRVMLAIDAFAIIHALIINMVHIKTFRVLTTAVRTCLASTHQAVIAWL
jgi:hypothetical protein